ncbi:glycosyltransferase family 2 protein [Streptomyces sp. NPDC010273]|uniref:glycosyltransferase family 2 protein n=1 Tax=Streptomyces sp. NPDC010273 TaxID=3364829 RepID=UPI0036F059B8
MNEQNAGGARQRSVEIVVPVYYEAHVLAGSIGRLHAYLETSFPFPFTITVADNASTDATWQAALDLTRRLPHVHAYMDADLPTGVEGFLPPVAPLLSGHSDLAIGSRPHGQSAVQRGAEREFISRSYDLLLKAGLAARCSDAQCGFKAVRTDVFLALIHQVPVDRTDDPDSRTAAAPRRTRTATPVLPVGAPASSAEHLEYAS